MRSIFAKSISIYNLQFYFLPCKSCVYLQFVMRSRCLFSIYNLSCKVDCHAKSSCNFMPCSAKNNLILCQGEVVASFCSVSVDQFRRLADTMVVKPYSRISSATSAKYVWTMLFVVKLYRTLSVNLRPD